MMKKNQSCRLCSLQLACLLLMLGCDSATSSLQFEHPKEMDLPGVSFQRPDPEPLRETFENGLVAYIAEDQLHPLVTISAFVGVGFSEGVEGAAESLLRDLRGGPGNLAAGEFGDSLYRIAAEYEVQMNAEETELTISCGSEDFDEALALLAGSLRRPAIGDPAARNFETSPPDPSMETAVTHLRAAVFGEHPYGRPVSSEEYRSLTRNDVASFHRAYFVPGNIVLAVAGNVDGSRVRERFEELFGDWKSEPRPKRSETPLPPAPKSTRIETYDAEKLQGWVALGHLLPRLTADDWAAVQVMNYILGGGHFDTRLFRVTRDRRGLTNDASGFLEPATHGPGFYSFRTYGRPRVVRLLIKLTLEEIARIRSAPITEEELFVAKGALAEGEFAMRFVDAAATVRTFAQEWLRWRDHGRSASYPERIRAVTAERVTAVAQKYLRPDEMQIVVVGPIQTIENAPASEGEPKLSEIGGS